jgi:surface carbohydrate biosynthesis protein
MDSPRPWLLIPIETKVREFHAKLLLAAVAADSGYDVIIGEQIELKSRLRFLPRGIILEKGATPHQLNDIRHSRLVNNRVVAWCEEGLVYRNREAYLRDRISLEAMDLIDRFFAWGSVQAEDILGKAPDVGKKLVLTGNPRFDLLRPELRGLFRKRTNQLKETFGSYILIPTNFGRVNHFRGSDFVSKLLHERGAYLNQRIADFTRGWTEFLGKVYRTFLRMVPELARAFPNVTIIVRPHPSENSDSWKKTLSDFENIRVIHEGTVIPWIMAASVVVHNSCTTGVESYLLDVPVVAYRPVTSEIYDSKLPNSLSHQAATMDELIALVGAIRDRDGVPGFTVQEEERRRAIVSRFITSVDGPWASDRIVNSLGRLPATSQPNRTSAMSRVSMGATDMISALRTAGARARGNVVVGTEYRRHKFSGLELHEVQQTLDELKDVSGRFQGIKAEPVKGLKRGFRIVGR